MDENLRDRARRALEATRLERDIPCSRQTVLREWFRAPGPLLEYTRAAIATGAVDRRERIGGTLFRDLLDQVCDELARSEPAGDAFSEFFGVDPDEVVRRRNQLIRGYVHTVRAVLRHRDRKASDPHELAIAAEQFANALGTIRTDKIVEAPNRCLIGKDAEDEATRLLDQVTDVLTAGPHRSAPGWYTPSIWLAMRRLLAWLLGSDGPEPEGRPNRIRLLLIKTESFLDHDGTLVREEKSGRQLKATVSLHRESKPAAYFDLVTLGAMAFGDDFRQSLAVACWLATNRLLDRFGAAGDISVRISLAPHQELETRLHGPSASGMLILAADGTARAGFPLDEHSSGSFQIRLRNASPNDPLGGDATRWAAENLVIDAVGDVEIKLRALAKPVDGESIPTVRRVLLAANQTVGGELWKVWAGRLARETGLELIPVDTAGNSFASLDTALQAMTADARCEAVLEEYCRRQREIWDAPKGMVDTKKFPDRFIPCAFSKKQDQESRVYDRSELSADGSKGPSSALEAYAPVSDAKADENQRMTDLFALGDRLVITEDAGAGKSVFTRRGVFWCSGAAASHTLFAGRAGLAIRWESRENSWPASRDEYFRALEEAVTPCLGSEHVTAAEVVMYALKQGRVVLFLDALDQLADQRDNALRALGQWLDRIAVDRLSDQETHARLRVVVTSRAAAYHQAADRLPASVWQLCRLDGFSPLTQLNYLEDLIRERVRLSDSILQQWRDWQNHGTLPPRGSWSETRLTPDELAARILSEPELFGPVYPTVSQLLEAPVMIAMVRDQFTKGDRFPQFSNRADLYFQATMELVVRNEKIAAADSDRLPLVLDVVSAAAFQMMMDGQFGYTVTGRMAVERLKQASRRWIDADLVKSTDAWDALWKQVSEWAGLTSRLIVEESQNDLFGWKHRGMMEFFCGLFLARHLGRVGTTSLQTSRGEPVDFVECVADPEWHWAVRFALELSRATDQNAREWSETDSLTPLIRGVFQQQSRYPRPTQLIYVAWFTFRNHPTLERPFAGILTEYRQQFLDILAGQAPVPDLSVDPKLGVNPRAEQPTALNRAQRAAEMIAERDVWEHVQASRTGSYSFRELRPKYVEQLAKFVGRASGDAVTDQDLADWFRENRCDAMPDERPAHSAYALCSNGTSAHSTAEQKSDTQRLTFLMGASPEDTEAFDKEKWKDERYKGGPWREVEIAAFRMSTCAVTRGQYRLFDAVREQMDLEPTGKERWEQGKRILSPDDDCPITHVDWFDGFAYALWLGERYQLPTERMWEGAAWGGLDRWKEKDAVIGVAPYVAGFTRDAVNFSGKRTLPVRWDEARWAEAVREGPRDDLPGAYKGNGFGIWQMSGNTYEWCVSRWNESLDGMLVGEAKELLTLVDINMRCSVRGGCWDFNARFCRCSYRDGGEAGDRYFDLSLRVARTL